MKSLWILSDEAAPSHIYIDNDCLILENAYLRRTINCRYGKTVKLEDGDSINAVSLPSHEFSVTVDGIEYIPGTEHCKDWEVRILDGNHTKKCFEYQAESYNTHPYPYPAPGKCAELIYFAMGLRFILLYEILTTCR